MTGSNLIYTYDKYINVLRNNIRPSSIINSVFARFCVLKQSLSNRRAQTGLQWQPSVWPACWLWPSFSSVGSTCWPPSSASTSCSPTASSTTPTLAWSWPPCWRPKTKKRAPSSQPKQATVRQGGRAAGLWLRSLSPTTGVEAVCT